MSTLFDHSTSKHNAAFALAAFALLLASDARAGARIVREHAARPRAQRAQSSAPSRVGSGDVKHVRAKARELQRARATVEPPARAAEPREPVRASQPLQRAAESAPIEAPPALLLPAVEVPEAVVPVVPEAPTDKPPPPDLGDNSGLPQGPTAASEPALLVPTADAPEASEPIAAPAPMDEGLADPVGGNEFVPGVYLRAFGGIVRRSLSFNQDVYDRLRTLNTNLYVYRLVAKVYPSFRATPLRGHVGLIAGYENAFAGSVHDENFGSDYPIVHSELFGGVRVRRAVRGHELGFDLTIGRLTSGLDDGGSGRAGTPDISYGEARSALDLTVQLGGVHVNGALGFRVPFSYGQIAEAEWFPRVGGYGMEASTWASYPVAKGVSAEAALSLRHYVLEMNSEPEDSGAGIAEVAGGAVDAFFGGYIGMSFVL